MKVPGRFVALPVLALALAFSPAVLADTLISNLDGNDGSQSADLDNLRVKGMGFTMPSGDDYFLDYARLRLETHGPDVQAIVEIWDDAGGNPGSPLVTLDNPVFNSSGIANYDFTPSGQFTLMADTTYWIVAYGTGQGSVYDWKASSPAQNPMGLATHAGSRFDTNGPPPTNTSSIICSYEVGGTIVPEPSVGLMLLCAAGLVAVRRR